MSTVYIQPALLSVIKKYADQENRSASNYVSTILMQVIEKKMLDEKRREQEAA